MESRLHLELLDPTNLRQVVASWVQSHDARLASSPIFRLKLGQNGLLYSLVNNAGEIIDRDNGDSNAQSTTPQIIDNAFFQLDPILGLDIPENTYQFVIFGLSGRNTGEVNPEGDPFAPVRRETLEKFQKMIARIDFTQLPDVRLLPTRDASNYRRAV